MQVVSRSLTVLAALVFAASLYFPQTLSGQQNDQRDPQVRIAQLEKRVAELERIVGELRGKKPGTPAAPIARSSDPRKNWQLVKTGMTMEDVEKLLDRPKRVTNGAFTTWYYQPGFIIFSDEHVSRVSAP